MSSDAPRAAGAAERRPMRRWRSVQPSAVLWLTAAWLAMWSSITPLLVVSGVVVAVLVCVVFPLPPVRLAVRVRPWALLLLVLRFLADVVRASVHVTRVVLTRREVRNAVVAVELRSASDFVLVGVASMLSLVPGSIVVEARRSTHTLYLHVLDVTEPEAAESFRQGALALEQRILRALEPRVASTSDAVGRGGDRP